MQRRRTHTVAIGSLGLLVSLLAVTGSGFAATPGAVDRGANVAPRAESALPSGFRDVTAIGGLSQPVTVAFAGDGTAFIGLQTGVIKSFDFNAASDSFEPFATSTEFADRSVNVNNYGDRGLTGIAVDPQFPARPYVYVNYTYNVDPTGTSTSFPAWGTGGQYDECTPGEASITAPVKTGCPVMMRVSRLTAQRTALGWQMVPNSELPLVTAGCFQFDSHSSGDVVFGPDGKLYASAGDGASYRGTDFGQANNPCGDPADEGGQLRSQDVRTAADPLSVGGTIFRLDPDAGLTPDQASSGSWLVAYGQRNPWRLHFRAGTSELWSVDVGSSNWEEINRLPAVTTASLVNRGWPCYEGTTGSSLRNAAWDAIDKPLCESLYAAGTGAVQAPYFSYRTRTQAGPLTPGENCGPVVSSSMSGVAFTPATSDWPSAYRGSLYFTDFLRKCIWRLGKLPNGDPDPSSIEVFAQQSGAPTQLVIGPGGDLYYVDYGLSAAGDVLEGGGGVHRLQYGAPTSQLTLKSSPRKVKIKVDGKLHKASPYRAEFAVGASVKLVAPKALVKKGVRYVFKKWQGIAKAKKKRKQRLTIGATPVVVRAVYRRLKN